MSRVQSTGVTRMHTRFECSPDRRVQWLVTLELTGLLDGASLAMFLAFCAFFVVRWLP